jgi:hypothetical protein
MPMSRKERLTTLAFLLFTVGAWPGMVFSQQNATGVWVPFTANKVTRIYTLLANGEKHTDEITQFVARNGDGALYIGDIPGTPSIKWLRGTLLDARTCDKYQIDYEHKSFTLHRSITPCPLRPPTGEEYQHVPPERSLGTRMIAGVQCIGIKGETSRGNDESRETWVAPFLNFEVIETTILYYQKQNRIEDKIDLEDLQVGKRPDPELFRIPEGFEKMFIGPVSTLEKVPFLP